MKVVSKIIITSLLTFVIHSCAYNTEDLPAPENVADNHILSITYTSHAKAIIDAKCANCHSSTPNPLDFSQGPYLTSYAEVKAEDSRVQARALDLMTMPAYGSSMGGLTQAEKDTLQMWIDQGALQ